MKTLALSTDHKVPIVITRYGSKNVSNWSINDTSQCSLVFSSVTLREHFLDELSGRRLNDTKHK